MAEWDDDNFEPRGLTGGDSLSNKWEGEDEEDEVKENWEDEDEEKKNLEEKKNSEEAVAEVKAKPNKKKLLQEKLAEKERRSREVQEKRMKDTVEDDISPEEQIRREKESDLTLALETTFSGDKIDGAPSKDEFQELANTITKNIQQFSKSDEYPTFTENIIRGICTTLSSNDLRKIKTTIDNLVLEKTKIEKGDKPKKKGKGKAKLHVESENVSYNQYSAFVDDFDDFGEYI